MAGGRRRIKQVLAGKHDGCKERGVSWVLQMAPVLGVMDCGPLSARVAWCTPQNTDGHKRHQHQHHRPVCTEQRWLRRMPAHQHHPTARTCRCCTCMHTYKFVSEASTSTGRGVMPLGSITEGMVCETWQWPRPEPEDNVEKKASVVDM